MRFAQSLGGDLAVYSNDEEAEALDVLADEFGELTSTIASAEAGFPFCDENPQFCSQVVSERWRLASSIVIGLVPTADGGWAWINDESPTLDPTNDPVNNASRTSIGYEAPYATKGYWYLGSNNLDLNSPHMVLLELPGSLSYEDVQASLDDWRYNTGGSSSLSEGNAILNHWLDPDPSRWFRIKASEKTSSEPLFDERFDLSGIFWGTQSIDLVDNAVTGFSRDFNLLPTKIEPLNPTASTGSYPFVSSLKLLDSDGLERAQSRFAAEPMVWEVTFNRDMNTDVQPMVTFGPTSPTLILP